MPSALNTLDCSNAARHAPGLRNTGSICTLRPHAVSNRFGGEDPGLLGQAWLEDPGMVSTVSARLALEAGSSSNSPGLIRALGTLACTLRSAEQLASSNGASGRAALSHAVGQRRHGQSTADSLQALVSRKRVRDVERSETRQAQRKSAVNATAQSRNQVTDAPTAPDAPVLRVRGPAQRAVAVLMVLAGLRNGAAATHEGYVRMDLPTGGAGAVQGRGVPTGTLIASGSGLLVLGTTFLTLGRVLLDVPSTGRAASNTATPAPSAALHNLQILGAYRQGTQDSALESLTWSVASAGGKASTLIDAVGALTPAMVDALAKDPVALDNWGRTLAHLDTAGRHDALQALRPPTTATRHRRSATMSLRQRCQSVSLAQPLVTVESSLRHLRDTTAIDSAPPSDLAPLGACLSNLRARLVQQRQVLQDQRSSLANDVAAPGAGMLQVTALSRLIARVDVLIDSLLAAVTLVNSRILTTAG